MLIDLDLEGCCSHGGWLLGFWDRRGFERRHTGEVRR
jgi:hypothetical protein